MQCEFVIMRLYIAALCWITSMDGITVIVYDNNIAEFIQKC